MINLALAILIFVLTTIGFGFAFGRGELVIWYGLIPGVIALIVSYLLLARRTLKQLEQVMNRAQFELAKLQESMAKSGKKPSKQQVEDRMNRAIGIIKEGYKLKQWQFMVESQLNGQIGALLYSNRKFNEAETYLRNGFFKQWLPQAMLATIYFRQRKYDKMEEVFERACKSNKKESLLWGVYAWCLWKNKDRDGAIKILNRSQEFITDPRIEVNLLALQNNKKMKMDKWDNWFQFQLEKPSQMKMQSPFGRRGSRKALFRG